MRLVLVKLTGTLDSKANQSPVPVGSSPIDRHFHNPRPRVRILHRRYTTFCNGNVDSAWAFDVEGANGAKTA